MTDELTPQIPAETSTSDTGESAQQRPAPPNIGKGPTNPKDRSCVTCEVQTLQINVFFDGTWNSRYNSDWYNDHKPEDMTEALNDASDPNNQKKTLNPFDDDEMTYIRKRLLKDKYREDAISFSRAPTGVDQMARAFKGGERIISLYVDGSGTVTPDVIRRHDKPLENNAQTDYKSLNLAERDFSGDNMIGAGLGMGDTGVYGKLAQMFRKIYNALQQKNPDQRFHRVSFNVYGFSRGAATARMFVHRILRYRDDKDIRKEVDKMLSKEDYQVNNPPERFPTSDERKPLPPMVKLSFQDVFATRDFQVKFVGLFDTVSSVGANHDDDVGDELQSLTHPTHPPALVVHIAAAHEFRQKFGVVSIAEAVQAGHGYEFLLPGCHTDIGDGLDTQWEKGELNPKTGQADWDIKHFEDKTTICQKYNLLSAPIALLTKLKLFTPLAFSQVIQAEEKALFNLQRANFKEVVAQLVDQGWFVQDNTNPERNEIWIDDDVLTMEKIKVKRDFRLNSKSGIKEISPHYPKIATKIMFDLMAEKGEAGYYNLCKYDADSIDEPYFQRISSHLRQVAMSNYHINATQKNHYLRSNLVNGAQNEQGCYFDIDDAELREVLFHDYLHWCSSMERDFISLVGTQVSVPNINPNTNQFYRATYPG